MKVEKIKKEMIKVLNEMGLSKESARILINSMIELKDEENLSKTEVVKVAFLCGVNFGIMIKDQIDKTTNERGNENEK